MNEKTPNTKESPLTEKLKQTGFDPDTQFEPKVGRRFFAKMFKSGTDELIVSSYVIKSVSRPSFTRRHGGLDYPSPEFWLNDKEPAENKEGWLPLTMKLYDPIVPSTTQALVEFLDSHTTFDLEIVILGPVADRVEEWKIHNAEIIGADFGTLDWGGGEENSEEVEPMTITLTIGYKNVEFKY